MLSQIAENIGKGTTIRSLGDLKLEPSNIFALDIETYGADGLPGDCPGCERHGISGIALCNLSGESVYIVTNDREGKPFVPVREAIQFLNDRWMRNGGVVTIHYSKFDLSFLMKEGLNLAVTRVHDTWAINSIRSEGIYESNKLKDLVRAKFDIKTATEVKKDQYFKDHKTKDYGDLPVDLVSPYAQDDVRYSLMLTLAEKGISGSELKCHDIYIRNNIHLNLAERTGVLIDKKLMLERMEKNKKEIKKREAELKELLGSVDIEVTDDQQMMHYLHSKNLHSPPWEKHGEMGYNFDNEFLQNCEHDPLALAFRRYYLRKQFLKTFSALEGDMLHRIFFDEEDRAGYFPMHNPSVFSQGGLPFLKRPDFTDSVTLTNEVRQLFVPRPGMKFVSVNPSELPALLLAYYANDKKLMRGLYEGKSFNQFMEERTKLKPEVCGLVLRQFVEGSGFKLLADRLHRKKIRCNVQKMEQYKYHDKVKAEIEGLELAMQKVIAALSEHQIIKDRCGRRIRIPQDKYYRSMANLLRSSRGSLITFYLDLICRVAGHTKASLLLAHDGEFLFECPADNLEFEEALKELFNREVVKPHLIWEIRSGPDWKQENGSVDSHKI